MPMPPLRGFGHGMGRCYKDATPTEFPEEANEFLLNSMAVGSGWGRGEGGRVTILFAACIAGLAQL